MMYGVRIVISGILLYVGGKKYAIYIDTILQYTLKLLFTRIRDTETIIEK